MLRERSRDLELPAVLGEPALVLPDAEAALRIACERLLQPGVRAPRAARLLHARWKPGVAVCGLYELEFEAGPAALFALKRHAGAKAARVAAHAVDERALELEPRLAPSAAFDDGRGYAWTWIADRALRGLPRLYDRGRTKRWLNAQVALGGARVHRAGLAYRLLRYKPERRAVVALDAAQGRNGDGAKVELVARVLPLEHARQVAHARARLDGSGPGPWPRSCGADLAAGIVYEERLALKPYAARDPLLARALGTALAALHTRALAPDVARIRARDEQADRTLLARIGAGPPRLPDALEPARWAWVHGDAHAGQLARVAGAPVLLDLDECGAGSPLVDLAACCAEALVDGARGLEAAGAELLDAYARAGGRRPEPSALRLEVARALVAAAAATLRRLEAGATALARARLAIAESLLEQPGVRT